MVSINNSQLQPPQEVVVFMVPFPLQGHLNQLLHLSRLISAHKVVVHYVGTAIHNRQVLKRVQGWEPSAISNIIFHDFPFPTFQSPRPDPESEIKFPSHHQPLFDALSNLRQPMGGLLRELSHKSRRVVVVYDSLMGSLVQDFVNFPNAESYAFHSVSAFTIFFFLWENMGRPFPVDADIMKILPSIEGCFTPEFTNFIRNQHEFLSVSSGRIYNTCRTIEGQFLDLLARTEIIVSQKQWALGPFNPVDTSTNPGSRKNEYSSQKCMEWLDRQDRNSVVLASFGTTTTFTDDQIKELAIGLEESGLKFIWVLRNADEVVGKLAQLPKGFEERVKEMGIVVRNWAPQLEILGHFATGGFLSHCGWNSCMESMSMGVPIAAWPMHSDQPRNSALVTKVLKIGLVVKDWDGRNEIVKASTIATALKKLMKSKEGEEIRQRAVELGAAVRREAAQGGSTCVELESFISHISR